MAFSGAVKLADLDDFLGPSQECVKPKMDAAAAAKEPDAAGGRPGAARVVLDAGEAGAGAAPEFGQIRAVAGTAAITLDDCLACSGCVTSAETVLITQQSSAQFVAALAPGERRRIVVVTVSPQSRAAVAQHFGLGLRAAGGALVAFFRALGADAVMDAACAQDVALLEVRAELRARLDEAGGDPARLRPVLASECPGWVCYAEKTQGRAALDHVSRVRSPQQIMGAIVKHRYAAQLGAAPGEVYHATVMPCYDKKLEGSRPDFADAGAGTRDVDCVLTTGEVVRMVEEADGGAARFAALAPLPFDRFYAVGRDEAAEEERDADARIAAGRDAGASGGYVEDLYRHLSGVGHGAGAPAQLPYRRGRNDDFQEIEVPGAGPGGSAVRLARAYGFRNIQNVVRKLKRGQLRYAYVEVMACPSGCLNGGGQPPAPDGSGMAEKRRRLAELGDIYHSPDETRPREPAESPAVRAVYEGWLGCEPGGAAAAPYLHTQYHDVGAADINPLAIKW